VLPLFCWVTMLKRVLGRGGLPVALDADDDTDDGGSECEGRVG
jgi:hypothetical protein